jgi:hypothetical protein
MTRTPADRRTPAAVAGALLATVMFVICGVWLMADDSSVAVAPHFKRGVSLAHLHRGDVGYGSDDCRRQLRAIRDVGGNWIAITDFAYMRAVDQPDLRFSGGGSDREAAIVKTIQDAHALGLKVVLKPHIWSHLFGSAGKWHGDIRMNSEEDWDRWFEQYTQYMLHQARIAQRTGADLLCIGCEYEGTTASQEARWRKLIGRVRQEYAGPLTYASAFGEWPLIEWWDEVDYIGINAYFPVATRAAATEEEIRAGWTDIHRRLEPFARRWDKQLLFTELGYSASSRAAVEPWSYDIVDPQPALQARLYKVALEEAKKRNYMAGVFLWKWFTSDRFRRGEGAEPFVIQDREAVLNSLRQLWTQRK